MTLLTAWLAACGSSSGELTLMTFNIRYGTAADGENSWVHRSPLVERVIREHSPDVLGLQEALRFQLDAIGRAFPEYGELGVGREDGRQGGEYAAILYRTARFQVSQQGTFWFSDRPDLPGSASWGNRVSRLCTWARLTDRETGTSFYVYNVHLDHESQRSRERSVELLAQRIVDREPVDPVVVLGDFNAGEDNRAMQYLTGAAVRAAVDSGSAPPSPGLVDTFRARHPRAANVGTFNGFRGDSTGAKIDGILVTPDFDVLAAAIIRSHWAGHYPSDHFPVTARIRQLR